ncbi:MAG: zinc ribbon domain-containing protein [Clostridia bacterium]|nr:zinc ribbon domain-containing protein [Clostridia bacterium]
MYCPHCGHSLPDGSGFCSRCGHSLQAGPGPQTAPVPEAGPGLQARPARPARHGRRLLFVAVAAVLALVLLVALLPRDKPAGGGSLSLGDPVALGQAETDVTGSSLSLEDATSPLDGLTLDVPAGAYPEPQTFTFTSTPVTGHGFGELFNPVTPLVTIDNGHGFAAVPMELTIPIEKADGEFAMGFFYDRDTGRLEGIPCVRQDNTSITLLTAHFSDVVVSTVKKALLDGRIQNDEAYTAFLPGMSDFHFANYGSYAAPGGQCAGQTLAMIHYFNRNANDNATGRALRTEPAVDNDARPDTPGFWQDDALAYRLCAAFQSAFDKSWFGNGIYDPYRDADDAVTYYSFAYAMALTHVPQIMIITGKNPDGTAAGHAIAIYGVSHDALAVCDPNDPGGLVRSIPVTHGASGGAPTVTLGDYASGATADASSTLYDKMSYYGTYALVSFDTAERMWNDLEAGRDTAAALFPADLAWVAATGRDTDGAAILTPLADGLSVSRAQLEAVRPDASGRLHLAPVNGDDDVRVVIWVGTDRIGTFTGLRSGNNQWADIPLSSGANDIGILYERKTTGGTYSYVNFQRFTVTLSDGAPTPVPTETTAAPTDPGLGGRYRLEMVYTEECQHSQGIAAVAHSLPWVDPEHLGKTYTTEVDIAGAAFQPLPSGEYRIVIPEESGHAFTGRLSADGSSLEGTMEFTWTGDHWARGTFRLVRIG